MNAKFLRVAAQDRNVGAISSSSKFLIKKVVTSIKDRKFNIIIEYGPGDGVMTRELLRLLPKTGKLFVIENNPSFVATLRKIQDERLIVIQGKAQSVENLLKKYGVENAELVISSVPFSLLTSRDRQKLMEDSFNILKVGGDIIFFHQYIPIAYFQMKKFFVDPKIYFVARNLFPCFIARAVK